MGAGAQAAPHHPSGVTCRGSCDLFGPQCPWGGRIGISPPVNTQMAQLGQQGRMLLWFSCSVVSDSFATPMDYPARPLCPWDSPGKKTGVGCHASCSGGRGVRANASPSLAGRGSSAPWRLRPGGPPGARALRSSGRSRNLTRAPAETCLRALDSREDPLSEAHG